MPRPVVPIAFAPRAFHAPRPAPRDSPGLAGRLRSSRRSRTGIPRSSRPFISFISAAGDSTTPLPMMLVTFSRRMPDGIRWRTVFTVDYESMACVVTATVAYNIFSPFSQKINNLPLPSSPHWVPSTTTLLPIFQNHRLLKMDSTIAFQIYSTFDPKICQLRLVLISQSFSSTCSR